MAGFECHLENAEQQEALGAKLYQAINSGFIIYLTGDLGAGKTTLSRGFIQASGHTGAVKSPTYTLLEPYELNGKHILHFDLYRLADPEELEFIGIRDILTDDAIALIEWPDQGKGVIPEADLIIHIQYQLEGRQLTAAANTDKGEQVLKRVQSCQ